MDVSDDGTNLYTLNNLLYAPNTVLYWYSYGKTSKYELF